MLIRGLPLFSIRFFSFACLGYLPCGVGSRLFPPSMTSVSCWDGLLRVAFFLYVFGFCGMLRLCCMDRGFLLFFSDVLSFLLHLHSYGLRIWILVLSEHRIIKWPRRPHLESRSICVDHDWDGPNVPNSGSGLKVTCEQICELVDLHC